MTEERKRIWRRFAPLAAFVAIAVLVLGAIAVIPYDLPGTTPPNTYGNLLNGGVVAQDGTMLYYVNGDGVLYCQSSPNCYRIDEHAGSLCPYGNSIVYRRTDGTVVKSDFRGEDKTVLLTGTRQAVLSGNWVYFTRRDGILHKYSLLTGKEVDLRLPVRDYLIASNTVLYTDADGYLNTAMTDGRESTRFFATPVETFTRYKGYVFYVHDGVLSSVASANAASKQTYFPVREFNITEEGLLVFTDDAGLHTYDLAADNPKVRDVETQGGNASHLSVWDERILYYNEESQLILCQPDGSEWQVLS